MNRSTFRAAALTLCLVMLCIVAVGCQPQTPADSTTATTTDAATTTTAVPPAANLVDATDSAFLGTWNVSAQNASTSSITFKEDGTLLVVVDGSRLGGAFVVEDDTHITLNMSNNEIKATYVIDGDVITLTSDTDVWTLTKPQ